MTKTAQLSIRLDDDVKEKLRQAAQADGRKLAQYIERVLIAHLAAIEAAK